MRLLSYLTNMDTNNAKKVLVGYWPLLDFTKVMSKPGDVKEGADVVTSLSKMLSEIEIPPVAGIMWAHYPFDAETVEETVTIPVILMDRAAEIADHLLMWMENDVSRFTLHFEQRDIGYAVLLLPDVLKSIERWKAARLIYHEEVVTDNDFSVIYQTLGTCCLGGKTFEQIKGSVQSPCHVGFLDLDKMDPKSPEDINPEDIVVVGPFRIVTDPDDRARMHLDNLFSTVEPVKSKLNES